MEKVYGIMVLIIQNACLKQGLVQRNRSKIGKPAIDVSGTHLRRVHHFSTERFTNAGCHAFGSLPFIIQGIFEKIKDHLTGFFCGFRCGLKTLIDKRNVVLTATHEKARIMFFRERRLAVYT